MILIHAVNEYMAVVYTAALIHPTESSQQKKKGILGKRSRNAAELEEQTKEGLQLKLDENQKPIKSRQCKVIEHLKLRTRRRLKSMTELEAFLAERNTTDGLEYSYAEKCTVLRE